MNLQDLRNTHDVQNITYMNEKAIACENEVNETKIRELATKRIEQFKQLVAAITADDVTAIPSYVEAVDFLVALFDDIILECALLTGRRGEVEKCLLDLCKEAIAEPTAQNTRDRKDEHVVASLIDGLILSEIPLGIRASGMTTALLDATNPLRLGLSFFKIFCDKYPEEVNEKAFAYLKLEEEIRVSMLTENNAETANKLTKLFEMPLNNPEKYLLMSLYSFTNGFTDDAKRALELGLATFPENERLTLAKEGLKDF